MVRAWPCWPFSKLDMTGSSLGDPLSFCTTCERDENYMFLILAHVQHMQPTGCAVLQFEMCTHTRIAKAVQKKCTTLSRAVTSFSSQPAHDDRSTRLFGQRLNCFVRCILAHGTAQSNRLTAEIACTRCTSRRVEERSIAHQS